ncbi:hypothetical protein Q7C36_003119 [Tachysurus vachellii]|uniref:Ig-like domain-containing protein n=1 Tax=Tachysurus vachellii TaxID=175792 RepID=A0AA88NTF6_TACVA|nr:hypothetical protein Q7C36_003119 [Tachysurus vachellii]
MIRLFVALCAFFSLHSCENVTRQTSSNIKEIDMRTVKHGEDVTMKCNISSATKKDIVVWYRQISGKLPQFIAKPYTNKLGYRFIEGFNDDCYSIKDDEGEYFCGEMEGSVVTLTSGTRLQFEGKHCTANMRVFSWLSISRIGVLSVTVIIITICYKVLKSRS